MEERICKLRNGRRCCRQAVRRSRATRQFWVRRKPKKCRNMGSPSGGCGFSNACVPFRLCLGLVDSLCLEKQDTDLVAESLERFLLALDHWMYLSIRLAIYLCIYRSINMKLHTCILYYVKYQVIYMYVLTYKYIRTGSHTKRTYTSKGLGLVGLV